MKGWSNDMMFNWQKDTENLIPPTLPGYDFVQSISVFIPIKEVGLTVWERRTTSVTFIHECILKAINSGVHNARTLAELFGIGENVMTQIVAQLDNEGCAHVSADDITITKEGCKTLETLQKIQNIRRQLSRLFVNQITGEITERLPTNVYREPPRNLVYLDEVYATDLSFFRGNIETLSALYRENQLSRVIFGQSPPIEVELYRILDIYYEKLTYVKDKCFVYINRQDSSLAFKFKSGIQAYEDALQNQLNKNEIGASKLFSHRRMSNPSEEQYIQPLLPDGLIAAFNLPGDRQARLDAIEEAYFKTRPILDGEIDDILLHCSDYKPKDVFISMPVMDDFLTDTIIPSLAGQSVKSLIICYDNDDRSAQNVLEKIKTSCGKRKDMKLEIRAKSLLSTMQILLGSSCAIQATYLPKETVYRRTIYRLSGRITFEPEQIRKFWETAKDD